MIKIESVVRSFVDESSNQFGGVTLGYSTRVKLEGVDCIVGVRRRMSSRSAETVVTIRRLITRGSLSKQWMTTPFTTSTY